MKGGSFCLFCEFIFKGKSVIRWLCELSEWQMLEADNLLILGAWSLTAALGAWRNHSFGGRDWFSAYSFSYARHVISFKTVQIRWMASQMLRPEHGKARALSSNFRRDTDPTKHFYRYAQVCVFFIWWTAMELNKTMLRLVFLTNLYKWSVNKVNIHTNQPL